MYLIADIKYYHLFCYAIGLFLSTGVENWNIYWNVMLKVGPMHLKYDDYT